MYKELGGYPGFRQTPLREQQECRISIIAEWNIQAEERAEEKRRLAEQQEKWEEQRRKWEQK